MKLKIEKTEYKKIVLNEFDVEIPEEQFFFFFHRVAYSVKPEFTTWNKETYDRDEELYKLNIVEVDTSDKTIKCDEIFVNDIIIQQILNEPKHHHWTLLNHLIYHNNHDRRTKEQFENDFYNMIKIMSDLI